jgi:integrase
MSPTKRGGVFYLYVPKQKGGVVLRTTGTAEKRIYTLMKAMLARLKSERRWTLLNAIVDGRLSIGQVYDADRTKTLDALEASLSASPLTAHVTAYLTVLKSRGKAPRHIENVKRQLEHFIEAGYTTTADLTNANVTAWLASLTMSSGTARQYCFAVTGLTRYLVAVDVLAAYPLGKVVAPDPNDSRMMYVDADTDERIVAASRPDVRALFAFIKGTGCDVTTALNLVRRDVSNEWTVRLKGTKTSRRDVHFALIEPWAWGYLRGVLKETLPNAKVFPGITRSVTAKQHTAACEAVKVDGYTLKDARHSVAVRMAKRGYTIPEIAEQLGTSQELVARVYARFIPKMAHRVTADVTGAAQ